MPARHWAARKRRRGTASVEVVMMLPFFIIVFFGVYWMHGHYMGRQQAMLRARSCGWVYAAGGCGDKDALRACLANDGRAKPGDSSEPRAGGDGKGTWPEPDGQEMEPADPTKPEQKEPQLEPPAKAGGDIGSSGTTAVVKKLEGIPLIGEAIKWLFGKPVTIDADEPFHAPRPIFGAEEVEGTVTGHYSTLCNSVPQSWDSLAKQIFCKFVVSFPGC